MAATSLWLTRRTRWVGKRWAGEGCHLALWRPPSFFRKPPAFFRKQLPSSSTLGRPASADQGMTRVVGYSPPPPPRPCNVILSRHIGKGVGGDGLGFPAQSLWALVPLPFPWEGHLQMTKRMGSRTKPLGVGIGVKGSKGKRVSQRPSKACESGGRDRP